MSLNRTVLIGNLTRDPEARYTPQGVTVVNIGIAVNRYSKNESGDYDVDFFNLVAFRKTADYMSEYLKKGNRVAIEGRLQSRSWDDAETGQKRTVYEIVVDNVQNLTPRDHDARPVESEEEDSFADDKPAPPPARQARPAAAAPPAAPARQPRPTVATANGPRATAAGAYVAHDDDELDEADPYADEQLPPEMAVQTEQPARRQPVGARR